MNIYDLLKTSKLKLVLFASSLIYIGVGAIYVYFSDFLYKKY